MSDPKDHCTKIRDTKYVPKGHYIASVRLWSFFFCSLGWQKFDIMIFLYLKLFSEWFRLWHLKVRKFKIFFVHILGNVTTSYFNSEISWPLVYPLNILIFNLWVAKINFHTHMPTHSQVCDVSAWWLLKRDCSVLVCSLFWVCDLRLQFHTFLGKKDQIMQVFFVKLKCEMCMRVAKESFATDNLIIFYNYVDFGS